MRDRGAAADAYGIRLGIEAYRTDEEGVATLRQAEAIAAFFIGGRAEIGAFDQHRGANDRCSGTGFGDAPGDFAPVGLSRGRGGEQNRTQPKECEQRDVANHKYRRGRSRTASSG